MKGYKQTKIGLIPKDWEVVRLGDVFDIDNGKDYRHLSKGNIPVYGTGGCISFVNNYLHDGESVCIGRKGTIDKPIFLTGKFWCIDTLFYTYNFRDVFPKYLYFVFSIINWKKYNEATGVPSLSKKIIKRLLIPLPPLKEQEKIAKILSTWDEAIEKQEKLIKEKEKFKKALMQRLLKVEGKKREPKVRFKEFSGEWVDVDLEGLVNSRDILLGRGEVISKKDIENIKGNYPIYSSSTKNNGLFGYYGKYMFDEELITWSIDGGGDFFYRPKHKFSITNVSGFIKVLKKGKINTYFLALILQYKKQFLHFDYQSKAHPSVIKKLYKFYIPPTLKEQEKIADVLSTIDKEIDLLKLELNELKKQKKALMQKLLTGKVRVRV